MMSDGADETLGCIFWIVVAVVLVVLAIGARVDGPWSSWFEGSSSSSTPAGEQQCYPGVHGVECE